jgi:TRAP-type uncharacterized transport system substrate-binding protein
MKKFIVIAVAAMTLLSMPTMAAPAADGPKADCNGVKIATGPKGKGYSTLFADIAKVCGAKVDICEVNTAGGLDNLNALSTKEADMGLVQIDTWSDMKNGDENIAALQAVLPMNSNFLHVITSTAGFAVTGEKRFAGLVKGDTKQIIISRFSDLRGHTVALVGSAQLLGRRLDKQFGYQMQFVDVKDDAAAFDMVKKGQAAAAFTVSGWPSGTVKTLAQNSGLTMVPFDAPISEPYKVKPVNYKNIAVYNNNALAVPNVLVTRQFSGQRAANIASIRQCVLSNLTELKEGNYQPGWNEVNPATPVAGMQAFKAPAASKK